MTNESQKIKKHIHFIGIGGIGMSGIAKILLKNGDQISGSDIKENKIVNELKKLGASVSLAHDALNVHGADLVVRSSAIREDNPEIIEAKRLQIPLIKRAQALAELMKDKIVITVAGSHGKTTTSSLISYLLLEAGLSPTAALGGILKNIDANAYSGDGKFFVAEADESDGTFLYYNPTHSIITNIDYEHLDYYKDFRNEMEAFKHFMHKTEKGGCVFLCDDDLNLKNIVKEYDKRYVLFGLNESAHVYSKNIVMKDLTCEFDCYYNNKSSDPLRVRAGFIDRFSLALAGTHNISNSLSVIALGLELGISMDIIKRTLAHYKGAARRIEVKFKNDDYLVIDDYAHHPSEIKATLAAIKTLKSTRVIAVFQPHRYSRTQLLLNEFAKSFNLADYVIVTDIYGAGETPLQGVSEKCVCDKIKAYSPTAHVHYFSKEVLVAQILKIIKPGDLIITLGAGDITKYCDELVGKFKR